MMSSKKSTNKARSESIIPGVGLGISIDSGEVSPKEAKEAKKEKKEEKEKEKKEKKKDKNRERPILTPLNVEGGRTVFIAP